MKKTVALAYGKVILSGEHSVVYGQKALVAPINLGIKISLQRSLKPQTHSPYTQEIFHIFTKKFGFSLPQFNLKITANLPSQSGLGSSACFAVSLFKALLSYYSFKISRQQLFDLVLAAEKFVHGKPSGVDPLAVIYHQALIFSKNRTGINFSFLDKNTLPRQKIYLINSGQASESTKEMVDLVAAKIKAKAQNKKIIEEIGQITQELTAKLLSLKELDLSLIKKNQQLLENLGVVSLRAQKIIQALNEKDIVAKITGAGGIKTGSGMILAFPQKKQLSILQAYLNEQTLPYQQLTV